ncbi:MAG: diguanylate cyclase [Firmicutes bacterium]|nr:diguanylate cyclase [Bacillota bacterium]
MKVLSLLFFASGIVFFYMFLYAIIRQRNGLVVLFSLICFSLFAYNIGFALELLAKNVEQAKLFIAVEYLGISFLPALFVMLSYKLNYNKNILAGIAVLILFIPLCTVFLNATNNYHGLYYSGMQLKSFLGYTTVEIARGPWYYVFYVYAYLCLAVGTYFFYRCWENHGFSVKTQYFWLFLSPIPPLISGPLYFSNIIPYRLDIIPFSFLFLMASFFIILFKYDFLEIKDYVSSYIFDQIKEGILIIDERNRIIGFNKSAGLTFDWITLANKDRSILEFEDGKRIVENQNDSFEISTNKNGENKVFEFRVSSLVEKGKHAGKLFLFQDITEQNMAIERLNYMATYDMLCDIYNRNKLYEEIDYAMCNLRKVGGSLSLLMIDIDFFKQINDNYGHLSGDMVIRKVAQSLKKAIGESASVGRYGGEEFIVVLPEADAQEAFNFAERIRRHIEDIEFEVKKDLIRLTISIGIATIYNKGSTSLQSLIKRADKALYIAKNSGRNKSVLLK